jgi:hypothetical protein
LSNADEVAAKVAKFEEFFDAAWADKYRNQPAFVGEISTVHHWRVQDFVEAYAKGGYPPERLAQCVDRVIDLKLQLYYVTEVDIGAYNHDYYSALNARGLTNETAPPHLLLIRLAQDQNVIGKVRVLWERLMNLVYFVENGREISKTNSRPSKKKNFFEWVNGAEGAKWRWLAPFEKVIESHDSRFRTAEFHKNSVLRAEILRRTVDPIDVLSSGVNYFVGDGMWKNMMLVIGGQEPIYRYEETVPLNMDLAEKRREQRASGGPTE